MALFKKKMNHQVTGDSCQNHLDVMRANFFENNIASKTLPKPLWIRIHKKDALNIIYRDKDLVIQNGQIYYAYLVQANELLFQKGNHLDLPANILFSTHPLAEKHPEFLIGIGRQMFSYKDKPEAEIPEPFCEVASIITDDLDRSSVDFSVCMPDPDHPDEIIDDIDVHFCSVIVFHKDIPNQMLQGTFLPILAAPNLTSAALILPKEYWTIPFYTDSLSTQVQHILQKTSQAAQRECENPDVFWGGC